MNENREDIEQQYREWFPAVAHVEFFDNKEFERVIALKNTEDGAERKLPEYSVHTYYDCTETQRTYFIEDLNNVLEEVFFFSVYEICPYTYVMVDIQYLVEVFMSFVEDFGMLSMTLYSVDGKTNVAIQKYLDNVPIDGNYDNFEFDCKVSWYGYEAVTNYLNRWGNKAVGA